MGTGTINQTKRLGEINMCKPSNNNAIRKAYFKMYKDQGTEEKNKMKKLLRHLKKHPNDRQSTDKPIVDYTPKSKK